jgi:hypothetical protein
MSISVLYSTKNFRTEEEIANNKNSFKYDVCFRELDNLYYSKKYLNEDHFVYYLIKKPESDFFRVDSNLNKYYSILDHLFKLFSKLANGEKFIINGDYYFKYNLKDLRDYNRALVILSTLRNLDPDEYDEYDSLTHLELLVESIYDKKEAYPMILFFDIFIDKKIHRWNFFFNLEKCKYSYKSFESMKNLWKSEKRVGSVKDFVYNNIENSRSAKKSFYWIFNRFSGRFLTSNRRLF